MESDDYLKIIEGQGYELVHNPSGNGNCQFAAFANLRSGVPLFSRREGKHRF